MLKIDDNLLQEIGLGNLPADEKNRILAQIYETLEMRVGMTLASRMSEVQLKEFETFINSNDEQGALKWLESHFPNYKDVVAQELDKLKAEITQSSQQIVAAVQQERAAQGQSQPPLPSEPSAPIQPPAQPAQPLSNHQPAPPQSSPHDFQPPVQPMHPQQPPAQPSAPQAPPAYHQPGSSPPQPPQATFTQPPMQQPPPEQHQQPPQPPQAPPAQPPQMPPAQ